MPKRIMQSYQMIPERFKQKYFAFYQELYNPEKSVLDMKTLELISIAASLAAGCQGCFKGHVQKAVKFGASRDEVGEAIAVAIGIAAAAMVDQTDIANWDANLVDKLWGEAKEAMDEDEVDKPTP